MASRALPPPPPGFVDPEAGLPPPPAGFAEVPEGDKGLLVSGNIDLRRPSVPNPRGGESTVYSASFNVDGREVLLPLADEGRILTEDEALEKYRRTGKHLGIFASPDAATAYAKDLHARYERGELATPQPAKSRHPAARGDALTAAHERGLSGMAGASAGAWELLGNRDAAAENARVAASIGERAGPRPEDYGQGHPVRDFAIRQLEQAPTTLGLMASTLPLAVASGGAAAPALARAGGIAASAVGSRLGESAMEGGQAMQGALEAGVDYAEARRRGAKVFAANMPLAAMDAGELAALLFPAGRLAAPALKALRGVNLPAAAVRALGSMPGRAAQAILGEAASISATGTAEGAEEYVQEAIQEWGRGEGFDLTRSTPARTEAFRSGAEMGAALGAAAAPVRVAQRFAGTGERAKPTLREVLGRGKPAEAEPETLPPPPKGYVEAPVQDLAVEREKVGRLVRSEESPFGLRDIVAPSAEWLTGRPAGERMAEEESRGLASEPADRGEAPGEGAPDVPVGGRGGPGDGGVDRAHQLDSGTAAAPVADAGASPDDAALLGDLDRRTRAEYHVDIPDGSYRISQPAEQHADEAALARDIAAEFGHRVAFVEPTNEAAHIWNGTFVRPAKKGGQGTVVVSTRAQQPLQVVAAHEVWEGVIREAPDIWGQVEPVLREEVDLERWAREAGGDEAPAKVPQEFAGDFLGEQMSRPQFWAKLLDRAPDAFLRLVTRVREVVRRIRRTIPEQYRTEAYVRDLDRLRTVTADALAEYHRRRNERAQKQAARAATATAKSTIETERAADPIALARERIRGAGGIRFPKELSEEFAALPVAYRAAKGDTAALSYDEALEVVADALGMARGDATIEDLLRVVSGKTFAESSAAVARRQVDEEAALDQHATREAAAELRDELASGEEPFSTRRRPASAYLPGMAPEGERHQGALFGSDEAQLSPLAPDTVPTRLETGGRGMQGGLFEGDERQAARDDVEARRDAEDRRTGQRGLFARMREARAGRQADAGEAVAKDSGFYDRLRQAGATEPTDRAADEAARGVSGEGESFSTRRLDMYERVSLRRGREAMERVIRERVDVPGAMQRRDLGPISFVWGEAGTRAKSYRDGYGVAHVLARRALQGLDGAEVARELVEVIGRGRIVERYGSGDVGARVRIRLGTHEAVLALYGEAKRETWLLTGWRELSPDDVGGVIPAGATLAEPPDVRPGEGAGLEENLAPPEEEVKGEGFSRRREPSRPGKLPWTPSEFSKKQASAPARTVTVPRTTPETEEELRKKRTSRREEKGGGGSVLPPKKVRQAVEASRRDLFEPDEAQERTQQEIAEEAAQQEKAWRGQAVPKDLRVGVDEFGPEEFLARNVPMKPETFRGVAKAFAAKGLRIGRAIWRAVAEGELIHGSPEHVLREWGDSIPDAEEFFQRCEKAHTGGLFYASRLTDHLHQAWKDLSATDRAWVKANFVQAYEGRTVWPSKGVQRFAQAWFDVNAWIGRQAEANELLLVQTDRQRAKGEPKDVFKSRDPLTYVPHRLTEPARAAMLQRSGPTYAALVEEAEVRGIPIDVLFELVAPEIVTKRQGSLEHHRLADLPWTIEVDGKTVKILEDHPWVLIHHAVSAAKRLAIIEQFGAEGYASYADDVVGQIVRQGADPYHAKDTVVSAWKQLQGTEDTGSPFRNSPKARAIWNWIDAGVSGANLSAAVVSNLFGGHVPLMVRFGVVPAVRGYAHALTHAIDSADETRLRQLGYLHEDLMTGIGQMDLLAGLEQTRSLERLPRRLASGFLRATGFQLVNRKINHATAYVVAGIHLRSMLDAIAENRHGGLKRLLGKDAVAASRYLVNEYGFSKKDVMRMVLQGPTEEDIARATLKGIEDVNAIHESPMARPSHVNHWAWRLVMAYSTYVRKMGATTAHAVSEASHGNVAPLARLLVVGTVTGEVMIAVRNFLKDREREEEHLWERLLNDLLEVGTLGLVQGMGYGLRHFGDPGHSFFGDVFMPPHAETLQQLVNAVAGATKGKGLVPVFRALTRVAPLVDIGEKLIRRNDKAFLVERLAPMVYLRGDEGDDLEARPGRTNTARRLVDRWHELGGTNEDLRDAIRAYKRGDDED